jgi:hypothetical protein
MTANGTQFVNASVVDEAYRLVHGPQVVEMQVIVPRRKMQPKARSM